MVTLAISGSRWRGVSRLLVALITLILLLSPLLGDLIGMRRLLDLFFTGILILGRICRRGSQVPTDHCQPAGAADTGLFLGQSVIPLAGAHGCRIASIGQTGVVGR